MPLNLTMSVMSAVEFVLWAVLAFWLHFWLFGVSPLGV